MFHVRFVFVNDDRYVAVHNLHTLLAHEDPSQPHYIGLHLPHFGSFPPTAAQVAHLSIRQRLRPPLQPGTRVMCSVAGLSIALFALQCVTRLSFVLTVVQSDATPNVATLANKVAGHGQDFVIAYVLHQLGIALEDAKDSSGMCDIITWPI
jgi:hypothetical protein